MASGPTPDNYGWPPLLEQLNQLRSIVEIGPSTGKARHAGSPGTHLIESRSVDQKRCQGSVTDLARILHVYDQRCPDRNSQPQCGYQPKGRVRRPDPQHSMSRNPTHLLERMGR